MKRVFVLAVVLASVVTAMAANVEVKIPKEGWSIFFDSPPLSKKQESKKSGEYSFSANSGSFNLSLFVEKPRGDGTTNKDCYQYYWSRGSQNPLIAKDTVSMSETDKYVRVQYDIVAPLAGKPMRLKNVNYYFIFRGRWVDVHISVGEPAAADEMVFNTFDESLKYGP